MLKQLYRLFGTVIQLAVTSNISNRIGMPGFRKYGEKSETIGTHRAADGTFLPGRRITVKMDSGTYFQPHCILMSV